MELKLIQVKQIQEGLGDLSELSKEKKNEMSFSLKWNVSSWKEDTEKHMRKTTEKTDEIMEELGEKIYTKQAVLSNELAVNQYEENGDEKLVYWRSVIPPENEKEAEKRFQEMGEIKVQIGNGGDFPCFFKLSELKKLKISSSTIKSLMPIIEIDIDEYKNAEEQNTNED